MSQPTLTNPGIQIVYTSTNPNEGAHSWGDPEQVRCPACGYDYVHLGPPYLVDGQDNYKAWAGRGDLIVIPMDCENGHAWECCFGFHKGGTFAFIRHLRDKIPYDAE